MSERSPTPWTACDGAFWRIYDAANAEVVNAEGVVSEELSEQIVHAVNCHDEMVEALKSAEGLIAMQRLYAGASPRGNLVLAKIHSALSKACPAKEGGE